MSGALIVMARLPMPGAAKTRLCPPLSAVQAAQLYHCLLLDSLDIARQVPGVACYLAYPLDAGPDYFRELAPDFDLVPQVGNTLGERLDHVLADCLERGLVPAVAMSSDSPTLPATYVTRAFAELAEGKADVALGPCIDGGYYLIGLTAPFPRLLRGVAMSTPRVLQDTVALAEAEGLQVALLPKWYDVDVAADLSRLNAELRGEGTNQARHTGALLTAWGPEDTAPPSQKLRCG